MNVATLNIKGNELTIKDVSLTNTVDEIVSAIGTNNEIVANRINNLDSRAFDYNLKIINNNESVIDTIRDGLYAIKYINRVGEGDNAVETLTNSAILIQNGINQYRYKDGQLSSRTKTNDTWGNWITFEGNVTSVNGMTGAVALNSDDVKAIHDYSKDYLTFEAIQDSTFTFSINDLQYSLDDGVTWTTLEADTSTPTVSAGNKILWKQTGLTPTNSSGIGTFSATGNFNAYGNIMSLYYGDNFVGQTDLTEKNFAFNQLFYNNIKLVDVSNLVLPATTLTNYCYSNMFQNCTSLVTAPALPATTLASNCYQQMFRGCTSLVTAPALPAITLAIQCYNNMFRGCTSLVTASELPATTLANYCYGEMFYRCTSLVNAPELPAITLTEYCYYYMFKYCTSLVTAPALPATTLANHCYTNMFGNCTSLVIAPELPATTLANYCYSEMFYGCTSLVTAPALPATTLAEYCYFYMFKSCNSLVTAPELPATTLAQECYTYMFHGCSKLNYIKAMFTSTPSSAYTLNWVNSVSSRGTFIKNGAAAWNSTGPDGVPRDWNVYTESEYEVIRHHEINDIIHHEISNLNVTHTFYKNINIISNKIKIWIDDFSGVSVEEIYDNYLSGAAGHKQYHLTQDTLTIDNITYYIWESQDGQGYDWSTDRAYILTTTNDYDELLSQSLSEDVNNDFTSFGGFLNKDAEESYIDENNRIQYILDVEQDHDDLYIYVDNIKLNGFDADQTIEDYIDDPETCGCNPYELTLDTIEIDGQNYFIWERTDEDDNNNYVNIHYLLTTTNDHETLESLSVEASKYNLAYKSNNCIYAFMGEDNEIYETTAQNVIVKVE